MVRRVHTTVPVQPALLAETAQHLLHPRPESGETDLFVELPAVLSFDQQRDRDARNDGGVLTDLECEGPDQIRRLRGHDARWGGIGAGTGHEGALQAGPGRGGTGLYGRAGARQRKATAHA